MRCALLQPSYIPWRGYFDQIRKVDLFVFYDDVQYDKHGWRNRNRVKTANGSIWLTVPVTSKGNTVNKTPINEVAINWSEPWAKKHWMTLEQSYKRAPHFARYQPLVAGFYARQDPLLADFTIELTIALARELGLKTEFKRSSEIPAAGNKTDRILSLLAAVGATEYLSGPSARDYIEPEKFAAAGIALEYIEYRYPEYPQLHGAYDPQVSILDLLFMTGPRALDYFG